MKRNIIYKGVAALTVAGLFASCNSDYLDVKPTTNITEDVAMNTPEGVTLAMNGIIISMNKQYSNLDFNGNVGEAFIGTACNDALVGPYTAIMDLVGQMGSCLGETLGGIGLYLG